MSHDEEKSHHPTSGLVPRKPRFQSAIHAATKKRLDLRHKGSAAATVEAVAKPRQEEALFSPATISSNSGTKDCEE